MNGEEAFMVLIGLTAVAAFVLGGFFAVRSIYRFKAWQAGEKEELWTFLSLILGCGSLIFVGIPLFVLLGSVPAATEVIIANLALVGFLLGIAATGLMTFYYIQKWRTAK
jgi:uncharacterized membrane-anchored protein